MSSMFENPLPLLRSWPSFESDLCTVDSNDEAEPRLQNLSQDVDRPMIVDVGELMVNNSFATSQDSESTVLVPTVNTLPYCQLDDLSKEQNLSQTSSDLSISKNHSPLTSDVHPESDIPYQTDQLEKKLKGKSSLSNIFSWRKSQTKNIARVSHTSVARGDKKDSPVSSPLKDEKRNVLTSDCDIKDGGWKERYLGKSKNCEAESVSQSSSDKFEDLFYRMEEHENKRSPIKIPKKKHAAVIAPLISIAQSQKWEMLFDILRINPSLLSVPSRDHNGQTLLHVISQQRSPPNHDIVLRAIDKCPEAVKVLDNEKCLPLHYASGIGKQATLVRQLLKRWSKGASSSNIEGDMPLHVASWSGNDAEENVDILLTTFPSASEVRNQLGELPIHLACSKKHASARTVSNLLKLSEKSRNVLLLDVGGNSPLHIALKANASANVIEVFRNSSEQSVKLFEQRDVDNLLPLHIALTTEYVDPAVITVIIKAAPSTTNVPFPNGIMPTQIAVDRRVHESVVLQLVLADMPISLRKTAKVGLLEVFTRKNQHSWWYLVTNQSDAYVNLIDGILSEMKYFPHILALAQVVGPTDESAFECASLQVKNAFQKNLIVADRYAINPSKSVIFNDGSYIYKVYDRGQDIKLSNPLQWLQSGTTSIIPFGDEGVEVMYNDWCNSDGFSLHCYAPETLSDIKHKNEQRIRHEYKLSSDHIESSVLSGTIDSKYAGFVGYDIVNFSIYERYDHTLADVFFKTKYRRRKNSNWIRKSSIVLKHIAYDLMHLHDKGLIHGYLDASTVAKYEDFWKLKDISTATPIGWPMNGPLRLGIPPESVVVSGHHEERFESIALTKSVTFHDDIEDDEEEMISDEENYIHTFSDTFGFRSNADLNPLDLDVPSLEFSPAKCMADPSWDIWSFGLLMGQLCLHQSRVLLPNFEEAQDAHLKNLYKFDSSRLSKVKNAMLRSAGEEASDLIRKLLHPDPKKRPKSMRQILKHDYFHQHDLYFA